MKRILNNHYKSIIYISHPYGGKKENEEKVKHIIQTLEKECPNYLFISPIHSFSWHYHETDYQKGIEECLWLLEKCDEMWVFGDWKNSQGCNIEVEYCEKYLIPHTIYGNVEEVDFLYHGFRYKPYVSLKILEEHKKDLLEIETQINNSLYDYKNFEGIDFCDVNAGSISIRGHHKQIKGYTYGTQPKIKYDFSNKNEVVTEFVQMWQENDTEKSLKRQQEFIADGEKYGWD